MPDYDTRARNMLITEASSRQRMRAGLSEECISALAPQLMMLCEQLRNFWEKLCAKNIRMCVNYLARVCIVNILLIEGVGCD